MIEECMCGKSLLECDLHTQINHKIIGFRIRSLRKTLGLSQPKFCKLIGFFTREQLGWVETGKRKLKLWQLNKIAECLGVNQRDLWV